MIPHFMKIKAETHNRPYSRVANINASRGDVNSSKRPQAIADNLERGIGLGFLSLAWPDAWDYATSFTRRGLSVKELYGAILDMNNLLIALSGLDEITKMYWLCPSRFLASF
ncbi:uncharacterized protein G2W53_033222 [Senna tora]|uniref:Uncharacterized protein n=1 Tax=Senna tora TaxID=362788 RepID=A0A834SYV3_9FABA|nr:uncharacterized protein G2W53_033222 [Senna tora]